MMRGMRMCPTMGMMLEGMPGGVMGGGMLQMRGEMLKAIGRRDDQVRQDDDSTR